MPYSPSKRSTRMARGMNPTMSGHHPPAKHQKPPVRLCPLCPADSPGPIYGLTPFRSGEVETVEVHDFFPRGYEVVQELLLGVRTSIDFRQGPELGVRAEDEVHTGGGPLGVARFTIAAFKGRRRPPESPPPPAAPSAGSSP